MPAHSRSNSLQGSQSDPNLKRIGTMRDKVPTRSHMPSLSLTRPIIESSQPIKSSTQGPNQSRLPRFGSLNKTADGRERAKLGSVFLHAELPSSTIRRDLFLHRAGIEPREVNYKVQSPSASDIPPPITKREVSMPSDVPPVSRHNGGHEESSGALVERGRLKIEPSTVQEALGSILSSQSEPNGLPSRTRSLRVPGSLPAENSRSRTGRLPQPQPVSSISRPMKPEPEPRPIPSISASAGMSDQRSRTKLALTGMYRTPSMKKTPSAEVATNVDPPVARLPMKGRLKDGSSKSEGTMQRPSGALINRPKTSVLGEAIHEEPHTSTKPIFSAHQQYFTTKKRSIVPPHPYSRPRSASTAKHAEEACPETSRAQIELLQLSVLHESAEGTHRQWQGSAKAKLGRRFRSIANEHQGVASLEAEVQQQCNLAALISWLNERPHNMTMEDMAGILSKSLQEVLSLCDDRGVYAKLYEEFQQWTGQIRRAWALRDQVDTTATQTSSELDPIDPLGPEWELRADVMYRRLFAHQRELEQLDSAKTDSALERIRSNCHSMLDEMRKEVKLMREVHSSVMETEREWVEDALASILAEDDQEGEYTKVRTGNESVTGHRRGVWQSEGLLASPHPFGNR